MSFATLLVANRGEIARRIIRSAQQMGIRCVAVYVDADALAPSVGEADEAVRLDTSYLDGAAVLEAARAIPNVARHLKGKTIRKEIFVPGRLVNFVAT